MLVKRLFLLTTNDIYQARKLLFDMQVKKNNSLSEQEFLVQEFKVGGCKSPVWSIRQFRFQSVTFHLYLTPFLAGFQLFCGISIRVQKTILLLKLIEIIATDSSISNTIVLSLGSFLTPFKICIAMDRGLFFSR